MAQCQFNNVLTKYRSEHAEEITSGYQEVQKHDPNKSISGWSHQRQEVFGKSHGVAGNGFWESQDQDFSNFPAPTQNYSKLRQILPLSEPQLPHV